MDMLKLPDTWLLMGSTFCLKIFYTFKRQSHKMVKRTQTIRRKIADELFEYVWPFCETGA